MRLAPAFALPAPAVAAVAAWAAALAVGTGCEPWDPEQREQTFALDGKHAEVTCEGCHGAPPFESLPADCNSCHVPDQPCAPGETLPECHYYRNGQGQVQQCNACHTTAGWDQVEGGCEAPSPHGPDFFPLEGAHDQSCGSCHDATNYPQCDDNDDALCLDCHEAERYFAAHYADPATEWPAGTQLGWDCEPCHAVAPAVTNESEAWLPAREHASADTLQDEFESLFKVPHGAANDADLGRAAGDPVPTAITDPGLWVSDCGSCHPAEPADYVALDCTTFCHQNDIWDTHGALGFTQGADNDEQSCLNCHPAGRLDAGDTPVP